MKIRSVSARFEKIELSRPYAISFRPMMGSVDISVLEIRAESGRVGLGAATPEEHVTGETPKMCREALSPENFDWLVGRDIRELPALCRDLEEKLPDTPAARAAVDIALHDLFAQQLEVPLVDLLGRAHDSLPTSITIGIKSLEETLEEAREYLGRGFRIIKLKLGESLDQDLERLSRLRETVGKDILIRVDPNQAYTPDDVMAFSQRSLGDSVEFLEQPTRARDMDALRGLPAEIRRAVAADESLLREADALDLVAPPAACGIFNIKLMKCGGIRPGLRIAAIAEAARISLMWGCMDESIISITGALHAAFASPATRYLDLDGSLDLARDVVAGGFTLEDGCMRTLDLPGLGLEPLT